MLVFLAKDAEQRRIEEAIRKEWTDQQRLKQEREAKREAERTELQKRWKDRENKIRQARDMLVQRRHAERERFAAAKEEQKRRIRDKASSVAVSSLAESVGVDEDEPAEVTSILSSPIASLPSTPATTTATVSSVPASPQPPQMAVLPVIIGSPSTPTRERSSAFRTPVLEKPRTPAPVQTPVAVAPTPPPPAAAASTPPAAASSTRDLSLEVANAANTPAAPRRDPTPTRPAAAIETPTTPVLDTSPSQLVQRKKSEVPAEAASATAEDSPLLKQERTDSNMCPCDCIIL